MKTPSTLLSHNKFRTLRRIGFSWAAALIVLAILTIIAFVAQAADQTWSGGGTGNGAAWYTTTNWVGGAFPGSGSTTTNTDIATIPSTGTNPTIGINGATNATLYLGAINFTATNNRTIGDSSATSFTLQLNGATVNSVSNVILRDSNSATLTLQNNGGGAGAMTIALGNATDNIINIDSSGSITISSVISGTSKHLTLSGTGTGVLTLSGANTYSGGTTISSSTLVLGASGVLADAGAITLNGGTFKTGASTGFSETVGTLALTDNSTIALGTGSHTLTFSDSSGVSWTAGKTLTVTGWTGGYNGTSGTAGKIFVGSSSSGLTSGQLAQIVFFNGTSNFPATILSTGEVVPTAITSTTFYSKSTGNLDVLSNWGTNTDGTGTAPASFTANNQIFNIRNNTSPTIGANWTVSGTNSKVILGDSSVAAINFTVPSNFSFTGTIDIAAASSGSNTLTLQNSTIPTFGTLDSTSTVDYNGSGAQTVSAASYGNLTISGTRTTNNVTLANGTIDVAGTFSATATFSSGTYVPGSSTVNFSSASAQTIPAINYNTITNTGNGNRTLASGTIAIAGNFTPGSGTYTVTGNTVNFNGSGTQTITGTATFNNVIISNNGSGVTVSSGGTVNIAGDFTNNGVFTTSGATIVFNGSGTQTVSGSATNTTFNAITLNKGSSTAKVTASINVSTANTITFTNGTWEQSAGTFTQTGASNFSIPSTGGFSLTGSGSASLPNSLGNGSGGLAGTLSVNTSGTLTVGGGQSRLEVGSGGTATFTAGTVTINGRFPLTNGTTTINGATINIDPQVGATPLGASNNVFEADNLATVTMSSGSITIVDPLSATGTGREILLVSGTGTKTFSGGTISLGDGTSSTSGSTDGFEVVTGGITLNNLVVANQQGGSNRIVNLGNVQGTATASDLTLNGNLTINSGGTLNANVGVGSNVTLKGNWSNGGTFTAGSGTVTFNGAASQSISGSSPTAFATLAISNTGAANNNIVSLSQDISDTALNITNGIFDQGTTSSVTSGAVTVSSGATFRNFGTGDLTLSGNVSNSGTINFDGSGAGCGGADSIVINSSDNNTQRSWSGTGNFSMADVNVAHQGGTAIITVFSGTNSGNNGTNWVFIGGCTGAGGQTYVWVGPSTDDSWTTPANWQATNSATPGRVPATNDVLIFDGSTRPTPTVSNVPTQTIAALRIINNAFPSFSTNGANTLTIDAGSGGLGFDVNNLNITGSNALTIKLASGTLGSVSGTMTVSGGAHRLIGSAANAITFQNGSTFTTSTGFTGNAFGTGAAGDGAAGSVVFANNAFYIHNAGSSPFGSSGNASVVVFQTGSTAKILNATNFQANGRTYADLIIGDGSAAITPSDSGTLNFQFDNLTVNSPSSGANSTLTYTGSGSSAVTIQGNITSTGTGDGTKNSDVTLTAGSGGVVINNSVTFSNSAGSRTITFGSNATVNSNKTLTLQRNLLITNSGVLTINGTLSAGANGYVIGSLLKTVSSSATFEVGTANGYSPVSLANINGSANFTVLAVNAYMNGLTDTTRAIQRYWTLTNGGITSADVTFQYVPGSTSTGGDVSNNVDTTMLNAFRRNANGSINELTSSRSSNTVTTTGVTAFSDWTLANSGSQVTLARLRSFDAINTGNGNILHWQTSYEVDNLGFNLYRMEGNNLVRVTPSMVAGSALIAGARTILTAGMSYSWRDAKGSANSQYYLEDVDLNGTRTMNGPFVPISAESAKVSVEGQSILLNELNNAQTGTPAAINAGPAAQFTNTAPAAQTNESNTSGKKTKTLNATSQNGSSGVTQNEQLAEQRAIASGQAVKIAVKQAGWYHVSQAELVAAGLPASVDPRLLQLYADGVEQPILVSSSNPQQFGADAAIEFYGTGLDTQMTDTHIYWLVVGTQPGKRVNNQSVQAGQSAQVKGSTKTETMSAAGTANGGSQIMMELPTRSYAYTVERKDRFIYFTALLNGDADNFFGPFISGTPTDQKLTLSDIDQLVSGPATLEIALQGIGTKQSHQVKVSYNGIEVGTISWDGQEHTVNQILIPRPYLTEGNNTVTLQTLNGFNDIGLVDYVRLTYYHTYQAENDGLTFSSPYTAPMMINGFTTPQVRVFDITDPNAVVQVDANVHQKGTVYVANVPEGNANRILMAVADSRVQHPASITANTPSDLTSSDNHADFIILTHPSFRDAVIPLADLRRSQGLETMVVNVDDVYDEFSYGAPSRDAIKDFFAYATNNWAKAPSYVLLVGDATNDPRNYLGTNRQDFVPTKMIDTSLMTTASDDALVDFNNDGIADISIGRLPAQTLDQAQKMIAKITGYVPGQSGSGALLVSDNNLGYDFEGATNAIHTLLPANMPVVTINRGDLPPDQVRSEIIAGIDQGPLIVNYAGHGSTQVWTGSGILSASDVPTLTNGKKVPFFVTMTCLNGLFQDVHTDSLAEALMKADGGGAVAVWASSGLTEPDPQAMMDQQLMRLLFSNGPSPMLGDAVRGAKQATTDLDVRRTWIFFGDPTMRIR